MTDSERRGLQAERTRLAWRRTTLAMTVTALVALGRLIRGDVTPVAVAVLVLLIMGWAAVLLVARNRIQELQTVRTQPPARRSAPAVLALLTTAVALLGVLLLG